MSSGLNSMKYLSGAALAVVITAALTACDVGRPAADVPDVMDVAPPPVPQTEITEKTAWAWDSGTMDGWTLSALPIEVTWPEGGGISLRAPLQPEFPDVFLRSPPLAVTGRDFTRILVDLETIVPGVQPDLSLYYTTPAHGEEVALRGVPEDGALPQAGERRVLVYDMNRPAIAADWAESTILSIRFDLPQGAGSHHVVHSIRICQPDNCD